jgi:hypothetical protein
MDRPASSPAPWIEWKERCALSLCAESTIALLQDFARQRFRNYFRTYAARSGLRSSSLSGFEGRDFWHLFETHVQINASREGKRYKDWLFARAGGPADLSAERLESGATLLMRDVVREFLRQEYSAAWMQSIQSNVRAGEEGGWTLEDLLPGEADPISDVMEREYMELADKEAARILQELSRREKIAIAAREAGLSLADPRVEQAAGCRKSMLNRAWKDVAEKVVKDIRRAWSDEDPEAVLQLTLKVFDAVKKDTISWISSEKDLADFFTEVMQESRTP